MKVLQLCYKMPFPQKDGGASSIYHTALGLISNNIDLNILAINTPKDWADPQAIPSSFREATNFEFSVVDTRVKPISAFLNLFSGKSYFVVRFYDDSFRKYLVNYLKKHRFDIIQLEHVYLGVYLETIRKYSDAKIILRAQNVEFQLWDRIIANIRYPVYRLYLKNAAARLKRFETAVLSDVDGILAISGEDGAAFRKLAPSKPVTFVPVGFDFEKIRDIQTDVPYNKFPVFYHLGSMDWFPNIEGLRWFIENVMPYVKSFYPGFQFRIAGKKMPAWFYEQQDEQLQVDGEVENSLEYQLDKAVIIVPLLSGGGIRVKIIEGMALGKTIISTTIGAEGIPYTDQENILIANTKEEFLVQIKRCAGSVDFCRSIGSRARDLAIEKFDCNKTGKDMILFYESLLRKQVS